MGQYRAKSNFCVYDDFIFVDINMSASYTINRVHVILPLERTDMIVTRNRLFFSQLICFLFI